MCEHFLIVQMKYYFKSNDANAYEIRGEKITSDWNKMFYLFPFKFQWQITDKDFSLL